MHATVRTAFVCLLIGLSIAGGKCTAQHLTPPPAVSVSGGLYRILESQNHAVTATQGTYFAFNKGGEPDSLALIVGLLVSGGLYPIARKRFAARQILRPSRP